MLLESKKGQGKSPDDYNDTSIYQIAADPQFMFFKTSKLSKTSTFFLKLINYHSSADRDLLTSLCDSVRFDKLTHCPS